jgi:hypothetical protein
MVTGMGVRMMLLKTQAIVLRKSVGRVGFTKSGRIFHSVSKMDSLYFCDL